MAVPLDDARKDRLIQGLQGLFRQDFDEELSTFRAEQILDHFLDVLAPQAYNQGVQDARGFMLRKLDDLDGEVHEPEQI
ncbi:MAG TPA: DUF2164 domain-containing protein [Longimicrobiales bacterium]|nr:DUF2164 domain-containing protein [Longimicrobiales bacterium]